jgi:hypothetical protein
LPFNRLFHCFLFSVFFFTFRFTLSLSLSVLHGDLSIPIVRMVAARGSSPAVANLAAKQTVNGASGNMATVRSAVSPC